MDRSQRRTAIAFGLLSERKARMPMPPSPDPVLSIVIVPLAGGKQLEPRQLEPPDLRHWQIEEFLRQTGKADNTQRVYRGQLVRFASWCNKSWLDVTPSDIGKYRRELKLKGLKATSVNHALNTLKAFYGIWSVNQNRKLTILTEMI
jgi:integrase/recombinase XerD